MIVSKQFPNIFGEDLGGVREDCDPLIIFSGFLVSLNPLASYVGNLMAIAYLY